jgi:dTDP-4-dehydrorhamnose 3,5-epimerase-like enzyme
MATQLLSTEITRLIELPTIRDPRGNLCVIESSINIPFDVARVYYLYDVPSGSMRAGHAHRRLRQLLVAVSGSFDVLLDDGKTKEKVTLNRPNVGLVMPPMTWREIDNFSSSAVCLVMASEIYDELDYIRSYDDFLRLAQ